MSKRPASRCEEPEPPEKVNRPAPRRPHWFEPGGDADPSNPHLGVPASIRRVALEPRVKAGDYDGGGSRLEVTDAEIEWMASRRPLVYDPRLLALHYGAQEASLMGSAVRASGVPEETAGALSWPGAGTRWSRFVAWWREQPQRPMAAHEALAGFARAAGRVRTYRALALDDDGLSAILDRDEIFPSGLLRPGVDAARLETVVEEHGAQKVAVCRLYISQMHRIGDADPSYSLHDDWQITCIIASEYASRRKKVHLFEVDVPAVESLGWTLLDVSNAGEAVLGEEYEPDREDWFRFEAPAAPEGVWLDSRLQRTERIGLYTVPFLRERLRNIYVFDSVAEIRKAVRPFVERMEQRHHE